MPFIVTILLGAPEEGFSWRETGHFAICEIAYRHLDDQAKEKVDEILGGNDFGTQCTWPDMVRKSKEWEHTYPWHFINVEDSESYFESINPKGDVLQALIKIEDSLRDPSAEKAALEDYLKFLGHFVGDIHQPLHVGRRSDLGGNTIKVTWFGTIEYTYQEILIDKFLRKTKQISLHKVWDLHMLDKFIEEKQLEDGTKYKHRAYADAIDQDVGNGLAAEWQDSTYLDWAMESLRGRERAYDVGEDNLDRDYYEKNIGYLNQRLLQAGYRLAGVINRIYGQAIELSEPELGMRIDVQAALNRKLNPDEL